MFTVERQREGETREVETGYGHVERGEKGVQREDEQGSERQEREEGVNRPFYSGQAYLAVAGNCGEEHTWLLPGTVGVEFRQNTNIKHSTT